MCAWSWWKGDGAFRFLQPPVLVRLVRYEPKSEHEFETLEF
jgi:hypothetical protein